METQRRITAVRPDASFVHVEASFRFAGDRFPFDVEQMRARRFLIMDLVTGRVDDGHPLYGYLRTNGATDAELALLRECAVVPDVMGVNYYPAFTTTRFEPGSPDPVPVEAGTADPVDHWLVPMGLYELERDAAGVLRRVPTTLVTEFRRLAEQARWRHQGRISMARTSARWRGS